MTTADNAAIIRSRFQEILGDRHLVLITQAYIAGIVLGRFWMTGSVHFYWLTLLFLLILAVLFLFRLTTFFKGGLLFFVAFAGAFSFYYALMPAENSILHHADIHLYIEGTVVEEPVIDQDYVTYQLQVETIETREGRKLADGRLLVKIYGQENPVFQYGDRLRLRSAIIEPKGLRNPGGFDYRFFLRSQGIDALVYPNILQVDRLGTGKVNLLAGSAINLRQQMITFIEKTLPAPSSDLLTAILFGQRAQLPAAVEENFRKAGAGHLMAVSGLHVGLVAAMIIGLFGRLRYQGYIPLILAIFIVFAYAYLTGMRPSALRAAIMISMVMGAVLLERDNDLPTAVAVAALATLFINPLLLLTVGFQLSYAATLALIYLYRPLDHFLKTLHFPPLIRSPLVITLAAQIGVLPLSVYYFHHLPAGALLFNLLFLPLIAFVVGLGLSGALLGLLIPYLGELLLWASRPLLELMLFISGFSSIPGFYLALSPPRDVTLITIYLIFTVFLLSYYSWEKRFAAGGNFSYVSFLRVGAGSFVQQNPWLKRAALPLALVVVIIFVWAGVLVPGQKDLQITFIDVGQGASALVEMPCGVNVLIDAGGEPAYSADPGVIGERVVLPYLRYRGIREIDLVVITHPHEDHFGGFLHLVEQIPIGSILISPASGDSLHYMNLLNKAAETEIPVEVATAGQSWRCGSDLQLDILSPPAGLVRGDGSELNNNSLVLLLHYKEVKVLFTGDIEDAAVIDLLSRYPDLKADFLQVPHHGGKLPSIGKLLEIVQPDLAVIQVGVNSFGHPNPQMLEALQEAGVLIYRTDLHGAVVCRTDGWEFEVSATGSPALAR